MAHKHEYRLLFCGGCGHVINVPIRCGNRFCRICAGPRVRRVRGRLKAIIKNLEKANGYSTKMVTLTIPNVALLKDGIRSCIDSFRRLRQRSFWKKKVTGGAFVIEVTGLPGHWHVHLHVICMARFIPSFTLSSEWSQVSPGKIVDVQKVPIDRLINYVTKYITKTKVPEEHLNELNSGFKNVRMFQCFGDWHALSLLFRPEIFACPSCGYTGFYLSESPIPWPYFGRAPPIGSHDRDRWNRTIKKHGLPLHPIQGDVFPDLTQWNRTYVRFRDRNAKVDDIESGFDNIFDDD